MTNQSHQEHDPIVKLTQLPQARADGKFLRGRTAGSFLDSVINNASLIELECHDGPNEERRRIAAGKPTQVSPGGVRSWLL